MQRHDNQTIERLKFLRRKGYSIEHLMKELSLPKTTIWHHIHKIKLSRAQIKQLRSNQGGSHLKKELALQKAEKDSLLLLSGNHKYLVSLFAMLYWAEGDNKNAFSFVNTNADMIRIFLIILNTCFDVKKERLMITVRYFTGMNRAKCLRHWSDVTQVPKNQIKMYYNDGGSRGRTEFGMCRITVRKGGYLFKTVRSLIKNISKEIIVPVA